MRKRVRRVDAVRAAFHAHGQDVVELQPAARALIAHTLTEARHQGVTRFAIVGGDGLLHNALPAIARSDIPVGVITAGTGNDFARALDLPTGVDAAVAAALSEPSPVDLIRVEAAIDESSSDSRGERLAATVVTGGFSGRVNARANDLRFPRGQQRYTIATLLELAKLEPVTIELTVDERHHELQASLFAIANTRYFGGGMNICPDASPTDGLLDVTVIGPTSAFELARVLPTVFSGRHIAHPAVTTYRGERIELTTDAELWADGEPLADGGQPVGAEPRSTTFTVASGALNVAGTLNGTH